MLSRIKQSIAILGLVVLSACGQSGLVEVQVDPDPPPFHAVWPTTTLVPKVMVWAADIGEQ